MSNCENIRVASFNRIRQTVIMTVVKDKHSSHLVQLPKLAALPFSMRKPSDIGHPSLILPLLNL